MRPGYKQDEAYDSGDRENETSAVKDIELFYVMLRQKIKQNNIFEAIIKEWNTGGTNLGQKTRHAVG